jgi:beta-glucosidase
MRQLLRIWAALAILVSAACTAEAGTTPAAKAPAGNAPAAVTPTGGAALYLDASQPVAVRVEDLLGRMTMAEKIGQMTQVDWGSLKPADVTGYGIGSVLSGGDYGGDDSPQAWRLQVDAFVVAALSTRLGIPLIFGLDAVHGDSHLYGAAVFPHNVGLGATRDAALVQLIGQATAQETAAIDVRWDFAPCVTVPQDTRWGRTYEGYSENTALVAELAAAYVRGLQGPNLSDPASVLATPKHFLGDGGTAFRSAKPPYILDQGDARMDEARLRALFLPPYQAALGAGAQSVMASYSSWNGVKMHANQHLLTQVLKGELGFKGFIVSDWQAIDQISSDYHFDVVTSINAGIDMVMVPEQYQRFISTLVDAVQKGEVPQTRIDDAVRRILTVKFEMGLFEQPLADPALLKQVGSDDHRALARQAVRESLVLLKNDAHALPLAKDTPLIFVAGRAADDIGAQSGGWTISWQGLDGPTTKGTTILQGIRQAVKPPTQVEFDPGGQFSGVLDSLGQPVQADVGIAVVGENPYAEGFGDSADPRLSARDVSVISNLRSRAKRVVVVLLSGRPLEITGQLKTMDALVAAWLPGTEGNGVSDVLFGDAEFAGKLPYTWQRWNRQLPFDFGKLPATGCDAPLFSYGYGLTTKDTSPQILDCPTP